MARRTVNSEFTTWLCGYAHPRANFPDPWKSAPMDKFDSSKKIGRGVDLTAPHLTAIFSPDELAQLGSTGGAQLSRNTVLAIHAMREHKHSVVVSGSTILVEYLSSRGDIEVVAYDTVENCISACRVEDDSASGARIFHPMAMKRTGADKVSSGIAVYIAMLVGIIIADRPECNRIASFVRDLLDESTDDDLMDENLCKFFLLSSSFYKIIAPSSSTAGANWIGATLADVGTTGTLPRIGDAAIYDYVGSATVLSARPVSSPVITQTLSSISSLGRGLMETEFFDSLFSGSAATYSVPVASGPMPSLDELREELKLDIHALSDYEKKMVPVMDEHYVVDTALLEAARTIHDDWNCLKNSGLDLAPNYIFEGDAGSGKTAATKFLADALGIPRTKMTMHPLFESSNLIGAFLPVFNDMDDMEFSEEDKTAIAVLTNRMAVKSSEDIPRYTSDILSACRRALGTPGVMDELAEAYDIPDELSCELDPNNAWERLGKTSAVPVVDEVKKEAKNRLSEKVMHLMSILYDKTESNSVSYRFILSELMRAFQHGWLVEVQEAASILRPGVLTELNSLLERNGRIELPNGKFITRHPDTIVIFTTNRDYAGNVDLNESLRDRCLLGLGMDIPPVAVMAKRAMMQLDFPDEEMALIAARTVMEINDVAKSQNIKGAFGMRSLLGWMLDLKRGNTSEDAFRRRVVNKMTTRQEDVDILMAAFRSTCPFVSSVATAGRGA